MYEYKKCCLTCAEYAYADYWALYDELTSEQKKFADSKFGIFDFNERLEFIIKTVENNHKTKENEQ